MPLFVLAAALVSIAPVQSAAPNRQPELASAPGLTALVFGSESSVWTSVSHNNGQSFSTPVRVAQVPALALGRHRGPRIVISGKTLIISAVYGSTVAEGPHAHGLPANGDLVAWRSTDEGHTWSKPAVINDVPAAAREGLHAMAAGEHGELAAVWLDLRSQGTRLYGAWSKDSGATWSKNQLLYEASSGTICQCCDPSLTADGSGGFAVMFRNVVEGHRDMYVASWRPGVSVSKPRKQGEGTWALDACPMDGGGVTHDRTGLVTAWRRDKTVYLDRMGQPEVALGEGKDVALAASKNGPLVAWTNVSGIQLHRPGQNGAECLSPTGSYPNLVELPSGGVLAAWEENGQIATKVLN